MGKEEQGDKDNPAAGSDYKGKVMSLVACRRLRAGKLSSPVSPFGARQRQWASWDHCEGWAPAARMSSEGGHVQVWLDKAHFP